MKKTTLKIINVKLLSPNGLAKYNEVIQLIHAERPKVKAYGDKHIMIKELKSGLDGKVFYGQFVYFTMLEGDLWFDEIGNDYENFKIPVGKHPNPKSCDFYFFPENHRLCFDDTKGVSLNAVLKYLKTTFDLFKPDGFEPAIEVESSHDFLDELYKAKMISKLEVRLSYSNNDPTEGFEKLFDNGCRSGNVHEVDFTTKAAIGQSLNLNESIVLKAALNLAKSNGEVKASIKDGRGRRKTLNTRNYPKRLTIDIGENNILSLIYDAIKNIFQND